MKKIVILITGLLSALPVYAEFERPPIMDLGDTLPKNRMRSLRRSLTVSVKNTALTLRLFRKKASLPLMHKQRQTTFTIIMATVTVKIMTEYFFT